MNTPKPLLYAHRGGAGLRPENSLPAYTHAIQLGADVIDIDVGMTKDGYIVAYHDILLFPGTTQQANGHFFRSSRIPLFSRTLSELKKLQIGHLNPRHAYAHIFKEQLQMDDVRIPTLDEIIEYAKALKPTIRFQIEIKTNPMYPLITAAPPQMVDTILNVLAYHNVLEDTEIHSFDWRNLIYLIRQNTKVIPSFLTWEHAPKRVQKNLRLWTCGFIANDFDGTLSTMIAELGGKIWCPLYSEITHEDVVVAQQKSLKVVPWTVNQPHELIKMLEFGVDGIITDYPDRFNAAVRTFYA